MDYDSDHDNNNDIDESKEEVEMEPAAAAVANAGGNDDVEATRSTAPASGEERPRPTSTLSSNISMIARKEPIIASLQDHFTLPTSSSLVRFRRKQNAARIFEENDYQVVVEETHFVDQNGEDKLSISVKRMTNTTAGTTFLRLAYTIVCALWLGFFFTFCLSVLLFLVRSVLIELRTVWRIGIRTRNIGGVFSASSGFICGYDKVGVNI
jgi:hypothetical protein